MSAKIPCAVGWGGYRGLIPIPSMNEETTQRDHISEDDLFDFVSGDLPEKRMRELEIQAQADPELAARIEFMKLLNPPDDEVGRTS